jgi:hypothetical protein
MAMRPKRAGTRRCWKDTTRAFSAIHTAQSQTQKRAAASTSIIIQQKKQPLNSLNYQRSRYFHASPFVGAKPSWELDNDDDIDPDDPDDIPDFLDDEDFASSLRDIPEQNDEADGEEEREKYRLQQEKVNDELDNRKGRPWRDPWEISEQQWMSSDTSSESLPDWSPTFVSRISLERLQVLPIGEGMCVYAFVCVCVRAFMHVCVCVATKTFSSRHDVWIWSSAGSSVCVVFELAMWIILTKTSISLSLALFRIE